MAENEEEFIEKMLELGLTAYEAQVYFVLFQLKYATVHDIHSACTVPRNKIYETLESLEEKGLAAVIDKNPLRYARIDIERVFFNLRRKEIEKLNRIEEYLKTQETKPVFNLESVSPHAYELHSQTAIESHLKALVRNTRKELIIGISDADIFNSLFTKQDLKKLEKRIDLYIVVKNATLKDKINHPCYTMQEDILLKNIEEFDNSDLLSRMKQHTEKLAVISDRRNILTIELINDLPIASVMLTRFPFVLSILFSNPKKYLVKLN